VRWRRRRLQRCLEIILIQVLECREEVQLEVQLAVQLEVRAAGSSGSPERNAIGDTRMKELQTEQGVNLNGILEFKLLSKNAHRTGS
jgi:hypothetical protein